MHTLWGTSGTPYMRNYFVVNSIYKNKKKSRKSDVFSWQLSKICQNLKGNEKVQNEKY